MIIYMCCILTVLSMDKERKEWEEHLAILKRIKTGQRPGEKLMQRLELEKYKIEDQLKLKEVEIRTLKSTRKKLKDKWQSRWDSFRITFEAEIKPYLAYAPEYRDDLNAVKRIMKDVTRIWKQYKECEADGIIQFEIFEEVQKIIKEADLWHGDIRHRCPPKFPRYMKRLAILREAVKKAMNDTGAAVAPSHQEQERVSFCAGLRNWFSWGYSECDSNGEKDCNVADTGAPSDVPRRHQRGPRRRGRRHRHRSIPEEDSDPSSDSSRR